MENASHVLARDLHVVLPIPRVRISADVSSLQARIILCGCLVRESREALSTGSYGL